jgi:hypothetical protein
MKIDDLVYYNGRQYQLGQLPVGVDTADVIPLDEWFVSQRVDKLTAVRQHKPPTVAVEVSEPAKASKRK